MPFGKHKGVKICDVDPSYKQWMLKQEGFREKNPDLAACFEGKAPEPKEVETDAAEDLIMADAPDGFGDWWWKQYGRNLRAAKSHLYIAHLRVALEAWKGALLTTVAPPTKPPVTLPPAPAYPEDINPQF
jgi:hypothetical protein